MDARYAVIGDPVAHSLSPRLFDGLFARLGLAASYTAERVTEDALPAFIERLRRGELQGVSVTLPHKVRVVSLLDGLDATAARTGAVNCIRVEGGELRGFNTDVPGIVRALGGRKVQRAMVLGAGGAARAAVVALEQLGAKEIGVANRTRENAEALASRFSTVRAVSLDRLELGGAEVLVQATSVGLARETSPQPLSPRERGFENRNASSPLPWGEGRRGEVAPDLPLHPGLTVLDLVYRPLHTPLLRRAQAAGANTVDGLHVLVFQALAQLELWTGHTAGPDVAAQLHDALAPEAE